MSAFVPKFLFKCLLFLLITNRITCNDNRGVSFIGHNSRRNEDTNITILELDVCSGSRNPEWVRSMVRYLDQESKCEICIAKYGFIIGRLVCNGEPIWSSKNCFCDLVRIGTRGDNVLVCISSFYDDGLEITEYFTRLRGVWTSVNLKGFLGVWRNTMPRISYDLTTPSPFMITPEVEDKKWHFPFLTIIYTEVFADDQLLWEVGEDNMMSNIQMFKRELKLGKIDQEWNFLILKEISSLREQAHQLFIQYKSKWYRAEELAQLMKLGLDHLILDNEQFVKTTLIKSRKINITATKCKGAMFLDPSAFENGTSQEIIPEPGSAITSIVYGKPGGCCGLKSGDLNLLWDARMEKTACFCSQITKYDTYDGESFVQLQIILPPRGKRKLWFRKHRGMALYELCEDESREYAMQILYKVMNFTDASNYIHETHASNTLLYAQDATNYKQDDPHSTVVIGTDRDGQVEMLRLDMGKEQNLLKHAEVREWGGRVRAYVAQEGHTFALIMEGKQVVWHGLGTYVRYVVRTLVPTTGDVMGQPVATSIEAVVPKGESPNPTHASYYRILKQTSDSHLLESYLLLEGDRLTELTHEKYLRGISVVGFTLSLDTSGGLTEHMKQVGHIDVVYSGKDYCLYKANPALLVTRIEVGGVALTFPFKANPDIKYIMFIKSVKSRHKLHQAIHVIFMDGERLNETLYTRSSSSNYFEVMSHFGSVFEYMDKSPTLNIASSSFLKFLINVLSWGSKTPSTKLERYKGAEGLPDDLINYEKKGMALLARVNYYDEKLYDASTSANKYCLNVIKLVKDEVMYLQLKLMGMGGEITFKCFERVGRRWYVIPCVALTKMLGREKLPLPDEFEIGNCEI